MSDTLIQTLYLIGTLIFILGVKKICAPTKTRGGLLIASVGLLVTVLATYFYPQVLNNFIWITAAIITGGLISFVISNNASIADLPKMIALYSAMGALAATIIAAMELSTLGSTTINVVMPDSIKYTAVAAVLIGSVSATASLLTFARLQGLHKNPMHLPMHQWLNALLLVIAITFGFAIVLNGTQFELSSLVLLVVLALSLGILIVLPISTTDMPVVISLVNALTGVAIGLAGFVIGIPAMMIAGFIVAAACFVLATNIARAKNKSISKILFGDNNSTSSYENGDLFLENVKEVTLEDAAIQMAFAKNVIVVPGYGMAVSQAQDKLSELSDQLNNKGVGVKFAIHPAAGRMPGHMNLVLSEAGISNDSVYDLDDINDDFANTDVVLIIGGNDVTNPAAHTDEQSPVFGMQILNADQAKQVIVIKRGDGKGYSNIENSLFYKDNTSMLYGDALNVLTKVVSNIKSL